jgi:hypothetical protein
MTTTRLPGNIPAATRCPTTADKMTAIDIDSSTAIAGKDKAFLESIPAKRFRDSYSRETYTAEKDAMIRFLRDDLENVWPTVAELYNEYWGERSRVDARKLLRHYRAIVPKEFQGRKKMGV